MVSEAELRRARSRVLKQTGRMLPQKRSLDTTRASVRAGLEVVEFDVDGAIAFTTDVASKNLQRISEARKGYAVDLFACAIMSGLVYGAAAEERRDG